MADVTFTVDGKKLTAPAGTLLIEACRTHGIEIPAFCYYPGLSLQAACRMCVVRLEKVPKLQTACTTPVAEGMVVTTESPEIAQARKATIELLLGNHPLDCPVCDAGGECELQDMTFKYGRRRIANSSRSSSTAKSSSGPRSSSSIARAASSATAASASAAKAWTSGPWAFRTAAPARSSRPTSRITSSAKSAACASTSAPSARSPRAAYRYKTRPWEMSHVGTVCTHCGDGCKTTLGVRRSDDGMEIVRGDNRDKSGINGDFLCIKGRYAFDFANRENRLTKPLVRKSSGAPRRSQLGRGPRVRRQQAARDSRQQRRLGHRRHRLQPHHERRVLSAAEVRAHGPRHQQYRPSPHRRLPGLRRARSMARPEASLRDIASAKAILLLGNDPTEQHPGLAWKIRTNVRLNQARLYVANHNNIKLRRQATAFLEIPEDGYAGLVSWLGGTVGSARRRQDPPSPSATRSAKRNPSSSSSAPSSAAATSRLSSPGARPCPTSNSPASATTSTPAARPTWASTPTCCPATFQSPPRLTSPPSIRACPSAPGLNLLQMFDAAEAGSLSALYIVGANPVARYARHSDALHNTFIVVQDMFLTETAQFADVILPAANLYEKIRYRRPTPSATCSW